MGDDEYFNLHNFRKLTSGITLDDQQYVESDQYANVTRNEVYGDIKRIYMSNNGKIQFRQRFDNTVEEFISIKVGKTEERQQLIKEMYEETVKESGRLMSELENETSNGIVTSKDNMEGDE